MSFGLCLTPVILKDTTFRKLDMFLYSRGGWETPTLLGLLKRTNLNCFTQENKLKYYKTHKQLGKSIIHTKFPYTHWFTQEWYGYQSNRDMNHFVQIEVRWRAAVDTVMYFRIL
jgi:hypothetical protein